jgi:hypothetical protein
MGNRILSKSRGHRLMRKQAARDTGRRMLDSVIEKAPGSTKRKSERIGRKRWQTEQGNIP